MFTKKIFILILITTRYLKDILISNFIMLKYILGPNKNLKPVTIRYNYKIENNWLLLTFTNMITMTPGSFTLDINEDERCVLIHFIDDSIVKDAITSLKLIEKQLMGVFS